MADDPVARRRRSDRLSEAGHSLREAAALDHALRALAADEPDLLLFDCGPGREKCVGDCRQLRAAAPTARLLCLLAPVDRELTIALFEAGADAVVAAADDATILAASKAVARRSSIDAALLHEEERFRTLADNIPVLCWMSNPDGWIFWYNQRWYDFTGTTPEEMQGWGWRSVHDPDHVDRVVERFKRSLEVGEPFEDTFPLRSAQGEYRWFLTRAVPIRDADGAIVRWFGSNSDVTREREAERALRAANAEAAALAAEREATLSQLAEGVIVADREGRIVFVNEAAARLHGFRQLEVAPEGYSSVYHLFTEDGEPYPTDELPLARAVRAGETVLDARWRIIRPDGTEVVAIGSARPIRSADNVQTGAVLTVRDDTARWRAEAALRELNATLEVRVAQAVAEREQAEEALRQAQKMEAVGQLTGGVAHDFNNLLTVITGNVDMALRTLGEEADPRVRRAIENAIRGAERAAALTQRLLAFARRQPLAPKPTDVNRLIGGMSDLLARALGEAVQIETVLAAGLWKVEVDQNQLESAILNLAVNARDAMAAAGKLTIETANARLDPEYTAVNAGVAPGQYVVVAVTDTGSGMPPATLERVFEPFFTTKQPGQGTGLGLSQVYGFVKQSGGHVKIYSEVGEGTTVRIYLPRLLRELADMEEALAGGAAVGGSHSETILVVEDDDDVRAYTTEMLRELGYSVLEAHDGAAALRLLDRRTEPVDLLFTDVVMPAMNGRELVEQARRLYPSLRVLFTTGYARNAIVHQGRLDPGVDLLPKPFTYASLSARVRDALDRAGIARVLVFDSGGDLAGGLRAAGYTVDTADEANSVMFRLKLGSVAADAVILDLDRVGRSAASLVGEMRAWQQELPILLLASGDTSELEERHASDKCLGVVRKPIDGQTVVDRLQALGLRCKRAE